MHTEQDRPGVRQDAVPKSVVPVVPWVWRWHNWHNWWNGAGQDNCMQPNTTRLSTKQEAEVLGLSEDTLRWWRHRGDRGPKSYALSARNVVYDLADLQAWADEQK